MPAPSSISTTAPPTPVASITSAIAVVEERRVKTGWDAAHWTDRFEIQTSVRHVERLPLGTSFTRVVNRIKTVTEALKEAPPIRRVVLPPQCVTLLKVWSHARHAST